MTRIPIACSLTPVDARDRIDEWRTFLAEHVESAARDGHTLRVCLRSSDRALLAAADLAAREKDCCGFFSFTIVIEADARWLHIEVPPDAAGVLDDFAELLPMPFSSADRSGTRSCD